MGTKRNDKHNDDNADVQREHKVTRAICSYGQHLYVVNVSSFVHEKMKIKPYILNVWLYL